MEDNGPLITLMFFGAAISAWLSSTKQRNVVGWTIMGLLLPLISVVALCCLPRLQRAPGMPTTNYPAPPR